MVTEVKWEERKPANPNDTDKFKLSVFINTKRINVAFCNYMVPFGNIVVVWNCAKAK